MSKNRTYHSRLMAYVDALYAGNRDAVDGFLAPDFGVHGGRNRDEHITHELWEYATREGHFDLKSGVDIKIENITEGEDGANVVFSIVNSAGYLVYRDIVRFNDDDLIIGDQAPFEIIGKLRFDASGVWRVIVAHQVETPPARINPSQVKHDKTELLINQQSDTSHVVEFRYQPEEDEFNSCFQRFRFYVPGEKPRSLEVYIPGKDHWAFQNNLFPTHTGDKKGVQLPEKKGFFWHLQVETVDGQYHEIEMPTDQTYTFTTSVKAATLTDALDHDWVL